MLGLYGITVILFGFLGLDLTLVIDFLGVKAGGGLIGLLGVLFAIIFTGDEALPVIISSLLLLVDSLLLVIVSLLLLDS